MSLTPRVPITLDKPRFLRFNMAAMAKFDKETGIDFLHGAFDPSTMRMGDLQVLIWACLLEDDPSVTLDQVGTMIDMSNLREATTAVMECLTAAQPKAAEGVETPGEPDPNAENLSA